MAFPDPKIPGTDTRGPQRREPAAVGALPSLLFAVISAFCGWKAAGAAFRASFNSYDNHDSAAPLLLASPIALGAFFVVAAVIFVALRFAWRRLRQRGGT